ncbi:hypothetical protein [Lysobacter soli]|uniref:hypothetical protein n=1 Tax=Lysobacter soli TaxID=453783 RepID=UPI003CF879F2
MSAKRKSETGETGSVQRTQQKVVKKTYVTFRNGHLQLDVRGYLNSREGRDSVTRVIKLSKGMPRKPKDETKKSSGELSDERCA